jgi:hypothetical protein
MRVALAKWPVSRRGNILLRDTLGTVFEADKELAKNIA